MATNDKLIPDFEFYMMGNRKATDNFYPEECKISYEWAEGAQLAFTNPGFELSERPHSDSLEGEARAAGGLSQLQSQALCTRLIFMGST